jgi:3-dehydroquinate synthetase
LGLPTRIPADLDRGALLRVMGSDKKRTAGQLRFVLLRDIGDVFLSEAVPAEILEETLAAAGRP